MDETMETIKEVDKQGRLVIPKSWRKKYLKSNRVLMQIEGGEIRIVPHERLDLTKYFDSVEAEIKSDLGDWKSVKREIYEIR